MNYVMAWLDAGMALFALTTLLNGDLVAHDFRTRPLFAVAVMGHLILMWPISLWWLVREFNHGR
jgi:hypothetical protein